MDVIWRASTGAKIAASAIILTLLIVLGFILAPQAKADYVDTSDCAPAGPKPTSYINCYNNPKYYHSRDGRAEGQARIVWHNDSGSIEITTWLVDQKADGNAPILKAFYWDGSNVEKTLYFHLSDFNKSKSFDTADPHGPVNNDTVRFMMCNGGTNAGAKNCSDVSGFYHHY